ncbi:MAG TPA: hypothetical protein EYQ14_12540 [Gammaproteobacteria bacterium]|nr:hypothetical protein [Gammaproteobacteria bacterium]HIL94363.1 hypothetical protein [Pseudomonadales bacterium]
MDRTTDYRSFSMGWGCRGTAPKYLLRDRDQIFGELFQQRVLSMGIEEVLTAYRSPRQNVYVERLNGSIRRGLVNRSFTGDEVQKAKRRM